MKEELNQGLNKVKDGLKSAIGAVRQKLEKRSGEKGQQNIDKVPLSGDAIDISTAREQDRGGGVTFYDTENSEVARGADKEVPRGLDSFGEKDTFEDEEATDHQTNRDRNQNSDLVERFYTSGLDIQDIDIRREKRP